MTYKGSKWVKEDHVFDLECPHCGSDWDRTMGTPALRVRGWNPGPGILYSCQCCHGAPTEAEIETGKGLTELLEQDYEGFEPTPLSEYRAEYTDN